MVGKELQDSHDLEIALETREGSRVKLCRRIAKMLKLLTINLQ